MRKNPVLLACFLTAALGVSTADAKAPPASAASGSTGQCKDGTYTDAASKSGACSGHKGVKQWYDAAAPASASTATPAPAPAPAPAPKPTAAPAPAPMPSSAPAPAPKPRVAQAQPQAAGGGPGMVWVNSSSKVYHCQGTKYYGATKHGEYMSESDAIAKGNHADHGKACH